jgi:ssDNA-binding Zn-finger/Zn-ribbon topoisomerase 1
MPATLLTVVSAAAIVWYDIIRQVFPVRPIDTGDGPVADGGTEYKVSERHCHNCGDQLSKFPHDGEVTIFQEGDNLEYCDETCLVADSLGDSGGSGEYRGRFKASGHLQFQIKGTQLWIRPWNDDLTKVLDLLRRWVVSSGAGSAQWTDRDWGFESDWLLVRADATERTQTVTCPECGDEHDVSVEATDHTCSSCCALGMMGGDS